MATVAEACQKFDFTYQKGGYSNRNSNSDFFFSQSN